MKKRLTFKQLLFEQQVLGILLFTMLVIFLWVISSIYFSYSASTLTSDDQADVLALDPTIDEKPLVALNGRRWWAPDELQSFPVSVTVKDSEGRVTNLGRTTIPSSVATTSAVSKPTVASRSARPF